MGPNSIGLASLQKKEIWTQMHTDRKWHETQGGVSHLQAEKERQEVLPSGSSGGANSVNTSSQTCSLQNNEKVHFCSLSLSVHATLWTAQKTDISCNLKAVIHFAFCRGPAHSPTAHTVREPTHQPRRTTLLTTRWAHVLVLLNKKTQVARDVLLN